MAGRLFEKLQEALPDEVKHNFDDYSGLNERALKIILEREFNNDAALTEIGVPADKIKAVKVAIFNVLNDNVADVQNLSESSVGAAKEDINSSVNKLSPEDLKAVYDAAISLGLFSSRGSLLGGIDKMYTANLPMHSIPGKQLESDLKVFNETIQPVNGKDPFTIWLNTAIHLYGIRSQSRVFKDALQKRNPQPTVSASTSTAVRASAPAQNSAQTLNQAPVKTQVSAQAHTNNLNPIPSSTATESELLDDLQKIYPNSIHKPGSKTP